MKVLNISLGVVVLVLAVASLVSSCLLYEKRVDLVNGWGKMTAAVSRIASALDENSGTNGAAELTPEALSMKEYATLDAKLNKLAQQAENVVKQRDALAESLRESGRLAEMKELPEASQLQAIATSEAGRNQVVSGVNNMRDRRNKLADLLQRSAAKVDVRVSAENLRDGDLDATAQSFEDRVDAIRSRFVAYQDTLSAISIAAGGNELVFTEENYAALLPEVLKNVKEMNEKVAGAGDAMAGDQRKIQEQEEKIQQLSSENDGLKSKMVADENKFVQYRRALGLEDRDFKVWEPGSEESRRAVRGKVTVVNEKFGYVAIDLGADSEVQQPAGGKALSVNPKLAPGMEMVVVRNTGDVKKVLYIAKIKLTAVDANTSIAEPVEIAPDEEIREGDVVYLPEAAEVAAAK